MILAGAQLWTSLDELTVLLQIPKLLKFRSLRKRRRGEKGEEHGRKGEKRNSGRVKRGR